VDHELHRHTRDRVNQLVDAPETGNRALLAADDADAVSSGSQGEIVDLLHLEGVDQHVADLIAAVVRLAEGQRQIVHDQRAADAFDVGAVASINLLDQALEGVARAVGIDQGIFDTHLQVDDGVGPLQRELVGEAGPGSPGEPGHAKRAPHQDVGRALRHVSAGPRIGERAFRIEHGADVGEPGEFLPGSRSTGTLLARDAIDQRRLRRENQQRFGKQILAYRETGLRTGYRTLQLRHLLFERLKQSLPLIHV